MYLGMYKWTSVDKKYRIQFTFECKLKQVDICKDLCHVNWRTCKK
jgi:hypothetical protein